MKIAVISDIHANLEAFLEVLSDIERAGAESVICLGDCIGYGPDPEEVSSFVRSLEIPTVMGNHELVVVRPEFLSWFNDSAKKALVLTEELMSGWTRKWIEGLSTTLVFDGALFVHGCPPDSITKYLSERSHAQLEAALAGIEQRISFVGHTHTLGLVYLRDGRIETSSLKKGITRLDSDASCIVNTGSVGQPRDGDKDAKYVIWDSSENTIEVRSVPYNAERTAEKIIRLGFPRVNADRLL